MATGLKNISSYGLRIVGKVNCLYLNEKLLRCSPTAGDVEYESLVVRINPNRMMWPQNPRLQTKTGVSPQALAGKPHLSSS